MSDPYPVNFDVEIDRENLRKYLRVNSLLSALILLGMFGIVGGFVVSAMQCESNPVAALQILGIFVRNVGLGLGISSLAAVLLDWLILKRFVNRYANSLRVSVEGPFLRIQETTLMRTDRRLHFRAIVCYAIQQDWLAGQFNVESLVMSTMGGGPKTIMGVKDGLKTRDLLSEVDRLRENAP